MLLRISLIVAIIAGLAAGGFGYYEATTQIPALSQQRDQEKTAKDNEIAAHNKTKAQLKKTKADLAQTQQDLADTKNDLKKAVAHGDALEKHANELTDKLSDMTKQRDLAQANLAAYKNTDLTPEQVLGLKKQIKDATAQIDDLNKTNEVLNRRYLATRAKLEEIIGPSHDVLLPADLKGKVLVVDPKWNFVVLSVGGNRGAVEDGEMLVSRNGKLVAKVIIRDVQNDRCIANIIPGWELGEPIEGDVVTPAHPAS